MPLALHELENLGAKSGKGKLRGAMERPFDSIPHDLLAWMMINCTGALSTRDLQALCCVDKRFCALMQQPALRRRRCLVKWLGSGEHVSNKASDCLADAHGRASGAFVAHVRVEGNAGAKVPVYACIGVVESLVAARSCNAFVLAYFPDGDVWSRGDHAVYEGNWPNPFGYAVGDVISVVVSRDVGRYKDVFEQREVGQPHLRDGVGVSKAVVTFYKNGVMR